MDGILTSTGPSSKLFQVIALDTRSKEINVITTHPMATVPFGPSHTSPAPRHGASEEQTVLELALVPAGYTGF